MASPAAVSPATLSLAAKYLASRAAPTPTRPSLPRGATIAPPTTTPVYLDQVFGPDGYLAARSPIAYEMRPSQIALAAAIDAGIRDGQHVLGEGPCGVGKSIAYAVPAIYHAHRRGLTVLIVTANIALQEQLVSKDLPTLQAALPWSFTFALLKGRNNFLCADRLEESDNAGDLFPRGQSTPERRQVEEIVKWSRTTRTGDRSELPFLPSLPVWGRVSVGADECKGEDCPQREECFYEGAREKAATADIVVTNYHMLCAHLEVRQRTGLDLVLPPFDVVIADEFHAAADICRGFFGFELSEWVLRRLARDAERLGVPKPAAALRAAGEKLFAQVAAYGQQVGSGKRLGVVGFVDGGSTLSALVDIERAMKAEVAANDDDECYLDQPRRAHRPKRGEAGSGPKPAAVAKRAADIATNLQAAITQSDTDAVYYIDLNPEGRAKICSKRVEVASVLRAQLFARSIVVGVSATLTTSGTFDFIRSELGVTDAIEVVAASPFDFSKQGLLILPAGLPEPKSLTFIDAVAANVRQVIEQCGGRTLALFTSYRNLNAVYDKLVAAGVGKRYRLLRQGNLPRGELVRIFSSDTTSCLLGTESFWTGIDVVGEALTGLVIDKLPFPSPDDPVMSAICERDPDSFNSQMLPRAIMSLRQGVGRLIRSRSDVGVVVILDRRVTAAGYGKRFLSSPPAFKRGAGVGEIGAFLRAACIAD